MELYYVVRYSLPSIYTFLPLVFVYCTVHPSKYFQIRICRIVLSSTAFQGFSLFCRWYAIDESVIMRHHFHVCICGIWQCSTAFQLCTLSVRWYSPTVQCTLPSVFPFLSLLFVFPFPDFSQSKLHEISADTFVRLCYFRHESAKRRSP